MDDKSKQVVLDSLKFAYENHLITFQEWQDASDAVFRIRS